MDRPTVPRFFYARNGEQFGPFDTKEFRTLAATGTLRPTDMVWREGMPEWVQASQVKGLFAAARDTDVSARALTQAKAPAQRVREQPGESSANTFQNFGVPASPARPQPSYARQGRPNAWTIGEVLSEAWRLTSGFKRPVWLAALALIVMQFVIGYLEMGILAGTKQPIFASLVGWAAGIIACWPLGAGLAMLGVYRAAGEPVQVGMAFGYYGRWLMIAGVNLLIWIFVFLGTVLLIVPGIYLSVSFAFAMPLMLDRGMGVWEAMETSRRLVKPFWWKVLLITSLSGFMILAALNLLGLVWNGSLVAWWIILGVAAIGLLPMAIATNGVLYQKVCGRA